ncbi:hypothetical protein [Aquabacterium sp.]|uniref:hypothetical protein n=1 Tax=Aquabacterium sp. TaxID=1872578 RepID=UPI0035B243EF
MPYLDAKLAPDAVFKRTRAGQCELIARRIQLSEADRRLLSVMTGFTRLADLAGLLGEPEVPHSVVASLLELGLIKQVVDGEGHGLPGESLLSSGTDRRFTSHA